MNRKVNKVLGLAKKVVGTAKGKRYEDDINWYIEQLEDAILFKNRERVRVCVEKLEELIGRLT